MSLDLETVDMSQIELAVRVQDNVGIQKGSAQIGVSLEQEVTGENLSHSLVLKTPDDGMTPFLRRKNKPGYKIHRFKMTTDQSEAAKLFRQKALSLRAKNKDKIKMSLAARVYFCEYKDLTPYDDISMTFYVRTNSQKDFFTLFKERDVKLDEAANKKRKESPTYCE